MIPVLYEATETNFQNNGIGKLSDAIVAEVEEAINGVYELFVKYPVNGAFFNEISLRSIIKAKPNAVDDPQPFRIYRITKPINGIVTVYARHLAYDLAGIPVSPFTADGVGGSLAALKSNAAVECPFTFKTDKSGGGTMTVAAPASIWSRLGGTEGSVIDLYGGEYSFDTYNVMLNTRRGADNGVAIRYGKNLTDLEQDSNCANCYTGVYPYWHLENELVTLPEKIIHAEGSFGYTRILTLDMTDCFEAAPTEEELRSATVSYIEANNIGVPAVSWKVEFVALEKTEEYKGKGFLERISLGDTVLVEFDELGVNASARAVNTVYNMLAERYESITLGRVKSNLAQTIADQQKDIERKPSLPLVEKINSLLAAAIMGANGGAVRLIDTNGDGLPDELYIADNPDPAQAIKVWRFNYEGWAASKTGYNGPFTMGATLDDGLLANFVTAANLVAGTIQSQDGETFYLDLDAGILRAAFESLTIEGQTVDDIAEGVADLAKSEAIRVANEYSDSINEALNQAEVFNRLTDGGTLQGIYMLDGQIYINASYLQAGTINSSLINTLTLFAKDIVMTGTFTNTTEAFLEPNRAVVDRISRHLLGTELISSAETAKYDFNNDGKISGTDLVLAQAAALGNRSFADWSGAVKTPVTCTINLSTPSRALVMSGTDMWGNYRESVIGVDHYLSTFASKEHLNSIVQMEPSGRMYRTIDGEDEWFNPGLTVGEEYRTTKRFEGSPVYTMAVACGDMPKKGGANIPHGCSVDKIVSCRGVTANGIVLPYMSAAGGTLFVSANRTNVVLYSNYDNDATGIVATIEYTKT